jgi:hypothetical protein
MLPSLVLVLIGACLFGCTAFAQVVAQVEPEATTVLDSLPAVAIPQETTQSVTDTLPVYAIPEPTVDPIDVLSATPVTQVPATPSFEASSPMSSSHAVNVDDTEIRVLLQQIITLLTEIIKLSK